MDGQKGFRGLQKGRMQKFKKVSCHNRLLYNGNNLKALWRKYLHNHLSVLDFE